MADAMSTTEPTDEMVQAAAEVFYDSMTGTRGRMATSGYASAWRAEARNALRAALAVAPAPSGDDLRAAEQLDTLSRLLYAEGWGQHYIDAVTYAARALGRKAQCKHENTHMRGWTQVCDDCGQGREIR